MEQNHQEIVFEDGNLEKGLTDIFSGKIPLKQALQKIRTRLLDLSQRNRLLNYKHPKGRSIQFVDNPNLDLVFTRLIDGKPIHIKDIPDPPTNSYTLKKPDVKSYAQSINIDTEFEFPSRTCTSTANKHTPKLQALYYPAELEKLCRKIVTEARTVIEETGTNMLYLVFGFLEFYDSEDSERPMLAPLISAPVTLEKGAIDPVTRTFRYSIVYSGEDVHENQTLREKLSQDFRLQMPTFGDEDEPSSYFSKMEQAIDMKKRWRVHYQLTLGFLSFGKLAIWADLDPIKYPNLLKHSLLKEIFSGGSGTAGSLFPEDYDIDSHPQGDLPIIYDADSSQHSAIIDVLSGENMVINGPPGTGKSQTITNIIAAGLKAGKRILFVSEKLAALEVVRHRLNQANLGHFCLELHSHKTQKKKLILDIQERLDARFNVPQQFQNKITTLQRHKNELNRYAELIGSSFANELDLTIYEIFWKTEKCRQKIGTMANEVKSLFLTEAPRWSYDEIEYNHSKIVTLGKLFSVIGSFDSSHPWWGFSPKDLAPGDDETIGKIVAEALDAAKELNDSVLEYQHKTKMKDEPFLYTLESLRTKLEDIPEPPECLLGELIPRIFNSNDVMGKKNIEILNSVIVKIGQARELIGNANNTLTTDCELSYKEVEPIIKIASKENSPEVLKTSLEILDKISSDAQIAYSQFENFVSISSFAFLPIKVSTLNKIDLKLKSVNPLVLNDQSCTSILEGATALKREVDRLKNAFLHVANIATKRGIAFDGSPASITLLACPEGIDEILPGVSINNEASAVAQKALESEYNTFPLYEISRRQQELTLLTNNIERVINEYSGYAQQLGFKFDSSKTAISYLTTLCHVSSRAPFDLLDYSRRSLATPSIIELLATAEQAHVFEKFQREALEQEFYLDALPSLDELKASVRVFRGGDSFFNIFKSDWRAAKKLYNGISRNKTKRIASEYETRISSIIFWIQNLNLYIGNDEYKEAFGPLFKGPETDYSKIKRLASWYSNSHAELLEHSRFFEPIDLTALDAKKVNQLAALYPRLNMLSLELSNYEKALNILLSQSTSAIENIFQLEGWSGVISLAVRIESELKNIHLSLSSYVKQNVTPKRAFDVIKASIEINAAKNEFDELNNGLDIIKTKIEPFLPGIEYIPCEHWGLYLTKLTELVSATSELGNMLKEFGDDASTPQVLRNFLIDKLALDSALKNITDINALKFTDWDNYLDSASRKITSILDIVKTFNNMVDPSKSPAEISRALASKHKANEIIRSLASDSAVKLILGNYFHGIDTNIDSIENTISWGKNIIVKNSIRNSPISSLLLSGDAFTNFIWVKKLLDIVSDKKITIIKTFNRFSEFGNFSWSDWNSQYSSNSDEELASNLYKRIDAAYSNISSVMPWSKYITERIDSNLSGLEKFVLSIESKKVPAELAGLVFDYVTYRSIGRNIYKSLPVLEGFSGVKHEKVRSDFASLDRELISLTGKSFAYEIDSMKDVPDGVSGYKASERTEMQLLWNELGKQRRHLPIRQLIKRAGRAIQALKPCFMMGPMSVAQYLEQGTIDFDMIVMDEASQLRPEESLGAIARGEQLIVVGDPKQLPPMNFFDRLIDDGDEDNDPEFSTVFTGSESILDICQQLFHPVRTLRWHYRSQHESLIAFSNHHFYNGKLIVFPSRFDRNNRLGVRYRYVKNGVYLDRKNVPEAQRVVDSVIEHMIKYPEESLGVVTLNQSQRDLIEDLFDKKMRIIDETQTFISEWEEKGWPFFIKNLENVQGDERDVIFISTTFGKAPGTTKPRQNFGPISRPDGWRRLNVLFTRSRRKIELFTSMLPDDIILDVKTPAGTRALRDYLDYAKRGVLTVTEVSGREPDSDFEVSVMEMLQNNGYEVVPQLGVAGFFIDLTVRNPDRPGEFLVAIECDGATYHSSSSARDRDRIRQDILESLGWKDRIWRIWSTDWFFSPRQESERLLEFIKERRAHSSSEPPPEYEYEDVFEEATEEAPINVFDEIIEPAGSIFSFSTEELYVEVGDLVTYCSLQQPDEKHVVMIVDSESNPRQNLINEQTPLAQALLDSTVGDEVELEVKGAPPRLLRILKIQRHGN